MTLGWSFADKIMAAASVVGIACATAWLAVPSSYFIKEISVDVEDGEVRFVRELPHGDVTAQWQSEITLLNGYECNSGAWRVANYQRIEGNTVRYQLGPWAEPCIEQGPPYYLTTTRRVLLFGVIPLRKSLSVTDVLGDVEIDLLILVPEE